MIANIVYNHPHWMLIDKPEGCSVQELSSLWQEQFQQFHPVHRLDKDTSGLWLIAKTEEANQALSMQFQHRQVKKAYLAITHKKPKKKAGEYCWGYVRV